MMLKDALVRTTFNMGVPPNSSLDKALQLAARLEDEEMLRKLSMSR